MTDTQGPPDGYDSYLDFALELAGHACGSTSTATPSDIGLARAELADLKRDNEAMSHNIVRMDKLLLNMNDEHSTLLDAAVACMPPHAYIADASGCNCCKCRLAAVIEEQWP